MAILVAKKVILDTDPGVDDALAIMLACRSPELDVQAITVVSGNVGVEKGCKNALRMLEAVEAEDVPVFMGLDKPLVGEPVHASYYHGTDGLGGSQLPEPRIEVRPGRAVDRIVDLIMGSEEGELTLITVGPLTNLATAMLMEPLLAKRTEIVMMGGAFGFAEHGRGNVTPVAEFNVYADPEAAKVVIDSGARMRAVGLDVTKDPSALIWKEDYEAIRTAGTATAKVVEKITRKLFEKVGYVTLHDVLAVATTIDPSLVTVQRFPVAVETKGEFTRGQTVIDLRPPRFEEQSWGTRSSIEVCTGVYGRRFLDLFLERVVFQ